jgi:hypothetical protein
VKADEEDKIDKKPEKEKIEANYNWDLRKEEILKNYEIEGDLLRHLT